MAFLPGETMNPVRFLCLSACGVLLAGLGLCPSLPAQQRAYILRGNANDLFGDTLSRAGDLNRDGFPDFLVGAEGGSYVVVFSGPDGRLLLRIDGPPGRSFGRSIASAGDADGDGFPDILVGSVDLVGGFAEIYSGRTGLLLHHFDGPKNSGFGATVAGIGDVDLDGMNDVAVGASFFCPSSCPDNATGKIFIFSGRDGSLIWDLSLPRDTDHLGQSLSQGRDWNLDGVPDFLAGGRGFGFVLSGVDGTPLFKVAGGASVAALKDVDGDGVDDFATASLFSYYPFVVLPVVRIYSGRNGQQLFVFKSTVHDSIHLAGGLDANQDGIGDVFLGGYNRSFSRILSGRLDSILDSFYELPPGAHHPFFGVSIAAPGDLNGDGFDDVVVGDNTDDTNGASSGAVHVFFLGPRPELQATELRTGRHAVLRVEKAAPLAPVTFHLSFTGFAEKLLGGLPGSLRKPVHLFGTVTADAVGTAELRLVVPAGSRGRRAHLQALEWQNGLPGRFTNALMRYVQ